MDTRLTMAHHGYDGAPLAVGDRIELHPGTDLWIRGARFGDVIALTPTGAEVHMDRLPHVTTVLVPYDRLRRADALR